MPLKDITFSNGEYIDSCSGCGAIEEGEKVKIFLDGTNPAWPEEVLGEITGILLTNDGPVYTITIEEFPNLELVQPCNVEIECATCCDEIDWCAQVREQADEGCLDGLPIGLVSAGETSIPGEATSSEVFHLGDTLHFWSSNDSIGIVVTDGSAVVDLAADWEFPFDEMENQFPDLDCAGLTVVP